MDRWTAEEYRIFLATGKEPKDQPLTAAPFPGTSPGCCQRARPSGISLRQMEETPETKAHFDGIREHYEQIDRETAAKKAEIERTVREAGKKPRKYRNEPTLVDGIRFDSKHEAKVYQELMLRVKAGELKNVLLQVAFLLPGNIKYVADFVTITPDMRIEGVYDAKSEATKKNRVYINKKKQMKACWDIDIIEV